jgi:hypothetical protein
MQLRILIVYHIGFETSKYNTERIVHEDHIDTSNLRKELRVSPAPLGPRTTTLIPLVITRLQSLRMDGDGAASSSEAISPSS